VPETTLNGSLLDVVDAEFGDLGVQTPVEVAPGVENSPEAQ
jgi:hypothetical protein